MKFLFDQNLSHRLVSLLSDVVPGCQHVRNVGLAAASDPHIWKYAQENGYLIVSKDTDFYQRSLLLGSPPKVVWLKLGNCATASVMQLLQTHLDVIRQFEADETASILILS